MTISDTIGSIYIAVHRLINATMLCTTCNPEPIKTDHYDDSM